MASIGARASSMKDLKSLTIPDSVLSIGDFAFSGCTALADITIGKGVLSVGKAAFSGCSELKKVNYRGSSSRWRYVKIGSGNDDLRFAVIVYDFAD